MPSFVDYLLNSPAPPPEKEEKKEKKQPVASADKKQKTLGERFLYSLNKFFIHDGPVGVLGRGLGTYDPTLHDLSVPYDENVRRNKEEVQRSFKEREEAFQRTAEQDPIIREGDKWYSPGSLARGASDFAGVMVGSLLTDPTTYIAPGRTAGTRIASQAGISGGVDAALQGADVGLGVRDEIDPLQVGINTAAGGALQGLGEGGAALARALRNRGNKPAEEVIEEFITGYDPEEGVLRVQVTDETPLEAPRVTHGDIRTLGDSGIQERPASYEMPNGDTFFVVERKAPGEEDFVPREVIGGRDFDGNPIDAPEDFLPEIEVDDVPSYGTPNELVNYRDPSLTQQITELTEDEAMDLIAQRTGIDPRTLPQENPAVPEDLPFDPEQAAAQRARLDQIGQEPSRSTSDLSSTERARLFADIEKGQEPLIYDETTGDWRNETPEEKVARHAQIDENLETSLRLDSPRSSESVSQRQEGRLGSIGPGQGIVPEELPEGILEPTRTSRSREATRELGREQFPDEETFLERGTVPDISPAAARGAELADQSLKDVVALAAEGRIDSPEFQAALDRANPLVEAHSKNSQTAGRTLNILGQDVTAKEARTFLELAQDPDRAKEFARLAERYADDPEAIRMIVRYSTEPSFLDKLYGLRMGFMLSGLKTQLYNTLGTSSHILVDLATKGVAAGIDAFRSGGDRVTFREMASRLAGVAAGARAAADTVGTAYRDGRPLDELSRADLTRHRRTGKYNIPLKAMAAQDEFFRQTAKYSNTYGLATRESLRLGLTGEELEDSVKQLVELALLPKKTLSKMIEARKKEGGPTEFLSTALKIARQSDEYAKDMRFMGEPSQLATKLSEARVHKEGESVWDTVFKGTLNLAFPFIRTPDNLIRTAINYTPGANLLTKRFKDDMAAGGARRSEALARVGISTGLAAGIFNLWQDGLITGTEPSDWRKRQAWQEAGNKPLAIKDAEGNVLGTLSGAEPWVYPVALLVSLFDEFQNIEDIEAGEYPEKISVAIVAMADQIKELGYLSGLNDLIKATEEAKEGKTGAISNFLANVGASFGTPAIVRQATQSFSDPVSRDTGADSFGERVQNRIISGYPSEIMNPLGLPGSKDLPARIDRQGREVGREFVGPDLLSRSERPLEEQTPLSRELARLEFGPKGEITPLIQPVEGEINSKKYPIGKLTRQQRRNYQVVTSAYFDAVMQEKMASPEWEGMRDDQRKEFIKKAYSKSKEWAKEDLFSDAQAEKEEEFIWGRVTSGRRTPAGNRAVGGVENSAHLTGEGIDLVPTEGVSWRQLEEKAVEWFGEENVLREKDHIHVRIPGGNVPYYGARGTQ